MSNEWDKLSALDLEIGGHIEEICKKYGVSKPYVSGTYNFSYLQEKGNSILKEERPPDLVSHLEIQAYALGGFVSQCGEGALFHQCTNHEGAVKNYPRCSYHLICRDIRNVRDGDFIICIDPLDSDNPLKFRVVDSKGKEISKLCEDIPGNDFCRLYQARYKVREISLEEMLDLLEKEFIRKNRRFPEIKVEVSKRITPLVKEARGVVTERLLQLLPHAREERKGFYTA